MSESYDYDADNMVLNEADDSDTEVEFVHPKIIQGEEKKSAKSSSGGSIDDDLFATDEATDGRSFMAVKPWLGAIVAPSNAPKNNPSAPDKQLRIEWMHGYRGFDSRSNAVYNARGHAVYPVAGVVVVYDIAARSQRHYMGHDDDVLCLSQHPTNLNLVATGQNATIIQGKGTPPHVCVWDTTDFTKTWILKGTQADRAFKSVAFSVDGRYLTTVSNDDNHSIKVWDWEKKQLVADAKGDANPIYLVKWNHKDPTEFVTVGKRHASFWRFDGHTIKQKKAQMGGKYPWQTFYAVAFSEKGYACVGGFDGSIYVFIGGKVAKVFKNIHQGKIFTIDWHPQGLVSGGTDGKCHILNTKLEVIKSFNFPHKVTTVYLHENRLLVGTQGSDLFHIEDINTSSTDDEKSYDTVTRGHWDGELWGLTISPDGKKYATAGEDNMISIWDIASHKLLVRGVINEKKAKAPAVKKASTTSKHPPNQCARSIAWSPDGKQVVIGCNSGEIHVFRTDNLSKIHSDDLNRFGKRQVTGQTGNWIQEIKYSPNGAVCAVGTHGSVIVLLDVHDGYKPKGALKAHNSFITHLDFSQDGDAMVSNCGAYELLFHNINENDLKSSAQVPNSSAFKDTKWATLTCTFGWGVQGIFDPTQDGTDVNCVDVNASRTLAVTGDDYGNVNLFRYPVAAKGNKFHAYEGHSSHVVTTRFTPDEKRVISVGGHDLAITQWLVV